MGIAVTFTVQWIRADTIAFTAVAMRCILNYPRMVQDVHSECTHSIGQDPL